MNFQILIDSISSKEPVAVSFLISSFCVLACLFSFYFQYKVRKWPFVWGKLFEKKLAFYVSREWVLSDQDYKAEVCYKYNVNGHEYTGHRLSGMYVVASHNAKKLLQNQLDAIEMKGDEVKVYYNPKKPAKSFLINGSKTQVIFTLAMMIFMAWGSYRCLELMRAI